MYYTLDLQTCSKGPPEKEGARIFHTLTDAWTKARTDRQLCQKLLYFDVDPALLLFVPHKSSTSWMFYQVVKCDRRHHYLGVTVAELRMRKDFQK